jgi:hypothetical protein
LTAEPNTQIKGRYIIDLTPGTAPLKTLSVREGFTSPTAHIFDISNITWDKVVPAAAPTGLVDGNTSFNAASDTWDARFDGVKRGRAGGFEAFVTFKNMSNHPQRLNPYGVVHANLHDPNMGSNKAIGNSYRANGAIAQPWPRNMTTEPQGEAKVRFVFQTPVGFKPNKLTLKDIYSPTQIDVALTIQ